MILVPAQPLEVEQGTAQTQAIFPTIGIIPLYGGAAANGPTDSRRIKNYRNNQQ